MFNKHGFTLIETLFVLSIICLSSLITMSVHIPHQSDRSIIQEVSQIFFQSHMNSIINKEKTRISLLSKRIKVESIHYQKTYQLPSNTSFAQHEFSYNENGHISSAKTLFFHGQQKDYHFVFQVGSGTFYVQ